jgi:hypothetical protein
MYGRGSLLTLGRKNMTLTTKRSVALYAFLVSSAVFGVADLLLYANNSWIEVSWLLNAVVGIFTIVAWCRYDSQIQNFPLSGTLAFIIWALSIVGVLMYLVRSRGWGGAARVGFGLPIFLLSIGLYYGSWYASRWVAQKMGYFG